ncbi:MAG: nondiscriminating aspartyl-tRNA synthetase [Clostridiales bacterium]|nr:nondiscriminating aspartyl-tRNA synthetase [Clostridiales bacterium]
MFLKTTLVVMRMWSFFTHLLKGGGAMRHKDDACMDDNGYVISCLQIRKEGMEINMKIIEESNTLTAKELTSIEEIKHHIGEEIKLHGSIYKIRRMQGFSFVLIRMSQSIIQGVYSKEFSAFSEEALREESCVRIRAKVEAESRSKLGFELKLLELSVLSKPTETLPVVINQKRMETSLETLLDHRILTLRNEKERAIFRLQDGVTRGFRAFLQKENFTEIHTPKIVYQGAEGGANIFQLDYFGRQAYLAQSPQFYKQMMTGVFERVFEIGPVFRAEKHDTSRHLNEYTSVDFEMGYIESFEELMQMEQRMLQETMQYLSSEYEDVLSLLSLTLPNAEHIPAIAFGEAKEWISKAYKKEITDFYDFEPEEERLLSKLIKKETGSDFVFVTHYPSKKRPFYAMEDVENPEVTLSFDLLFAGVEITTGGQRIHNYKQQIQKMKRLGMNPALFESYLAMHKFGIPPHGGLGLGLERFISQLLGFDNVRRATLFPRDQKRLLP